MRYSVEEYNDKFLLEFEYSKGYSKPTEELKLLYLYLATDISKSNRYKDTWMDEDSRLISIICAYESCITHGLKFNDITKPTKNNAYGYVNIIIRGSFAGTQLKQYKKHNLLLDSKKIPSPPPKPLKRVIKEGVIPTCNICHSSMVRKGYFTWKRKCCNPECPNSKL